MPLPREKRLVQRSPAWLSSRAAWGVAAALAGLFVVFFTVPWQPAEEAPIGAFDFSWMLLLHDAIATGRQFGTHIILPQGPLGFIGTSVYDPRTYWILIAARTVTALIAFAALWEAARSLLQNPPAALGWTVAITALIGRSPDHFFPACAVLLIFSYFIVNDRRLRWSTIALIALLAASSLIKVNQPFYAIAAIGTVTIDRIRQRDRWFWTLPIGYAAGVLFFYLTARQSISNLGAFLWGWMQVTVGHADAVGLPGPVVDAVAYLCIVVMVLSLIAIVGWKKWRRAAVIPVAGTGALLLLLYKHSFMRQDLMHVHMGPMVAAATAILYAPSLWRVGGQYLRLASVGVITLGLIFVSSLLTSYDNEGLWGYGSIIVSRCAANASAAASCLTDHSRLYREWEDARRQLREDNPVPLDKIKGTVDVYPHRQDVAFAYDLHYEPRPVVTSLVATSPTLADVNARHLRGSLAPETILFDVELVDRNFPTILDGESLPDLLTRYDVIDTSGAFVILRRAAIPREYRMTHLLTKSAHFDEAVPVPNAEAAPIWARVHFKKRLAGRAMAMLYKPATLGITVRTKDGDENSYRLLPSLAEEQGFLLSPLIKDRAGYARLAQKTWATDLRSANATQITVFVADGSQDASFEPEITVEFDRLEFERQR